MAINEKEIYDYILENIIQIENDLKSNSNDEQVNSAKKSAVKIIEEFRKNRLEKLIYELKNNQEWNDFTIAFYGETNAGKSTIIEALRIYFQEETKLELQEKFNSILGKYKSINQKIDEFKSQIEILDKDKNNQKYLFEQEENILNFDIEQKNLEELNRKNQSIFYKLFSFMNFSKLQKEIIKLNSELKSKKLEFEKKIFIIDKNIENKKRCLIPIENEFKDISNNLLKCKDGEIIGDGQSDFTKNLSSYKFLKDGQKFNILDIPGIEGNEKIVTDEIEKAVKKAHAVFYITSSSTPPQKGDSNKKGTLEKIKEHLGSQVEIYTIFNKRVTNTMHIRGVLVNEGEIESLRILDEKMKEILGNNYIGNKYLSARVAFLSLATCLIPDNKDNRDKNKFIEKFSEDELLQKSLFQSFCDFLTNSLVQNTKQKIKKSNFNKANNLLKEFILVLSDILEKNLIPLEINIKKDTEDVNNNLDKSFRKLKNDVETSFRKDLRNFENDSMQKIYNYIDSNVSNDDFKKKFEEIIKENIEIFGNNISVSLNIEITKFQNKIIEILDNFKRRVNDSIQDYNTFKISFGDKEFEPDIDIKSGINKWGLGGSLAGGIGTIYAAFTAGNIWNPAGWTAATIGAIFLLLLSATTVVIGVYKSVKEAFSDNYKKSNQKKAVDDNLESIMDKIEEKFSEKTEELFSEISRNINVIKEDLEVVLNHTQNFKLQINETKGKLESKSKEIKFEGEK